MAGHYPGWRCSVLIRTPPYLSVPGAYRAQASRKPGITSPGNTPGAGLWCARRRPPRTREKYDLMRLDVGVRNVRIVRQLPFIRELSHKKGDNFVDISGSEDGDHRIGRQIFHHLFRPMLK